MKTTKAQALAIESLFSKVRTRIVSVTPKMAEKWLKTQHPSQRRRKSRRANRYLKIMLKGEWSVNGEAIIITDTGVIVDGQHRLMAVVLLGRPVIMTVTDGIPAVQNEIDVFLTINTENRTNDDALYSAGYTQSTMKVLRLLTYLSAFKRKTLKRNPTGAVFNNIDIVREARNMSSVSMQNAINMAEGYIKNTRIVTNQDEINVDPTARKRSTYMMPSPLWVLFAYIAPHIERGFEFLDELSNENSTLCTIQATRNKLSEFGLNGVGGSQDNSRLKAIILFKGYDAYIRGVDMYDIPARKDEDIIYPTLLSSL